MRLIPILLLAFVVSPAHADFVKWVDNNGEVHYGTSIPPQYVNDARVQLNSRGIPVQQIPRAKTPAQLAQEKALDEMREQQKKLLQEQQARDQQLLKMYPNEDDLELERNGKLAQVSSLVKYKHQQLDLLNKRLNSLQAQAAELERTGRKMQPQLQAAIVSTEQQIQSAQQAIAQQRAERKRITEHYARDLARLRQLRGLGSAINRAGPADTVAASGGSATDMDWTYRCQSKAQCERLWPVAIDYLRQHTSMPVKLKGKRIVVTEPPATPSDIGITLSRLSEPGGERLFLDVQCQANIVGKQLCSSQPVQAIRDNFRSYLESHLNQRPSAR